MDVRPVSSRLTGLLESITRMYPSFTNSRLHSFRKADHQIPALETILMGYITQWDEIRSRRNDCFFHARLKYAIPNISPSPEFTSAGFGNYLTPAIIFCIVMVALVPFHGFYLTGAREGGISSKGSYLLVKFAVDKIVSEVCQTNDCEMLRNVFSGRYAYVEGNY